MYIILHRRLFLYIAVFVLVVGCDSAKTRRLEAELSAKNISIETLTTQNNDRLYTISQLQEQIVQLQVELDNLKVREAELRTWSRQLADSFGPGVWYLSGDERPLPIKPVANATARKLVAELNRQLTQYDLPAVLLIKIEDNTAFVRVSDENKLTQNMGTTGATAYIEAVTYTLTSLKPIRFVQFDFKEGDHALPGRYSR